MRGGVFEEIVKCVAAAEEASISLHAGIESANH